MIALRACASAKLPSCFNGVRSLSGSWSTSNHSAAWTSRSPLPLHCNQHARERSSQFRTPSYKNRMQSLVAALCMSRPIIREATAIKCPNDVYARRALRHR
jgi:hypothetical protein